MDAGYGGELNWRRPGVQLGVMRKLRRGHFRIERELDLHGMRVDEARDLVTGFIGDAGAADEARDLVTGFIGDAGAAGVGCVRIIHGKGHGSADREPVLKRHVGEWLAGSDLVLAYTSARPGDGGTGAVVVLLRRQ